VFCTYDRVLTAVGVLHLYVGLDEYSVEILMHQIYHVVHELTRVLLPVT